MVQCGPDKPIDTLIQLEGGALWRFG